eukprot:CAMPEP_0183703936 /NCGR_PEP_ID=MMETSP0737-20130205/1470_1 /TAXON_ID=385413 /ORGANISM="Thalassiosira miniscula, Strain CCMP1093" /LENGTH=366 /DNA_ID=CAMNT_0025930743 /DNA_START=146 /DNA_END=1246 /DNA_ORIENTATION=+
MTSSTPHNKQKQRRPLQSLQGLLTLLSIIIHVTSATSAASIASSIDYRYFVAGGSCAAISHGITTPIDVVKTRMQSNPEKYKSLLPATATIIKEEGAGSLVKGLGPTLVGYGIEGALKFGVYEISKPIVVMACKRASEKMKTAGGYCGGPLPFLVASILGGAVASLVLVPMESVRIRMVTDPEFEGVGLMRGLKRLVEEAGLLQTLTVGMGAMLAKQVPYTFGKQVSFDVAAKSLYQTFNSPSRTASSLLSNKQFVKWLVSVLAAMVASVMACLLSHPGDVILTETYKGHDDEGDNKQSATASACKPQHRSLSEVSSSIYSRKGNLSGFFTGLQARFVHVGMIITSQLVIYDLVKQFLGLPATGSH